MTRWVVSGTGTEVGKTFVACALASWLTRTGRVCAALKPVESGGGDDSRLLAASTTFHVQHPPPYVFEPALGPHLAARRQGLEVSIETCTQWVARASEGADLCITELPGALLSPLNSKETNADLLRELNPDAWVLVASDRLGVLHDVKAALVCTEAVGLHTPVVVLSEPAHPDLSTGTNAEELHLLGTCKVAAQFKRASTRQVTEDASAALARALEAAARP